MQSNQQSKSNSCQTNVLFDLEKEKIISFFSLSAYSINKEDVSDQLSSPVPKIPAILIGRLAVDKNYRNQGYGFRTLREAMVKIKSISLQVGVQIVVVDALNEKAAAFYMHHGFVGLNDFPQKLFLSVSTIP